MCRVIINMSNYKKKIKQNGVISGMEVWKKIPKFKKKKEVYNT